MQLHELKLKHKTKERKRVGRGGKRGTYSGRGQKGQKSRAGTRFEPVVRSFIKRYPKLRGYRFKSKSIMQKIELAIVNIGVLAQKFNSNDEITPQTLAAKGVIRKAQGELPAVKILAKGKITKALTIENCQISKQAREKIEKAGGKIKLKVQS